MHEHTTQPTTRAAAKTEARKLRDVAKQAGTPISHAEALEKVAHALGFRDWNTASARLSNQPELVFQVGDQIAGRYLKQPFEGRVVGVRALSGDVGYELTIHFDTPVDVVTWDSFSAHRQRVTAMVSPEGVSWTKTSDGVPHMIIEQVSTLVV